MGNLWRVALLGVMGVVGVAGGGLTLRVRMGNGATVRVAVDSGEPLLPALRRSLRDAHGADGDEPIFLDAGETEGVKEDATAAALKLRPGAFLYVSRAAAKAAAASNKQSKAKAKPEASPGPKGKAAAGPPGFVPFPDLQRAAPRTPKGALDDAREKSIRDIEDEEARMWKVKRQTDALAARVGLSTGVAAEFGQQVLEDDFETPRWALLLGRADAETKSVLAELCWMLPRPKSGLAYCDPAALEAWLADADGTAKSKLEVAEWLKLRPVGWVFSYGDEEELEEDQMLREGDLACATALQTWVMEKYGREWGAKFVTLRVSPGDDDEEEEDDDDDDDEDFDEDEDDEAGISASGRKCIWETPLAVSRQGVMMAWEGVLRLRPGSDAAEVKTTEPVRLSNAETRIVDPDVFVVPLPIQQQPASFIQGLPREMSGRDGGGIDGLRRALFSSGKDAQFQNRIQSYELLCKLHEQRVLDKGTLRKICAAVRKEQVVDLALKRQVEEALRDGDADEEDVEDEEDDEDDYY